MPFLSFFLRLECRRQSPSWPTLLAGPNIKDESSYHQKIPLRLLHRESLIIRVRPRIFVDSRLGRLGSQRCPHNHGAREAISSPARPVRKLPPPTTTCTAIQRPMTPDLRSAEGEATHTGVEAYGAGARVALGDAAGATRRHHGDQLNDDLNRDPKGPTRHSQAEARTKHRHQYPQNGHHG